MPERVAELAARAQSKADELVSIMDHAKEGANSVIGCGGVRDCDGSIGASRLTNESRFGDFPACGLVLVVGIIHKYANKYDRQRDPN